MARFLIRSVISTIVTMLLVSIILFLLLEVGGRDITRSILGVFATPEQRESLRNQLGLDEPAWQRYMDWLIGNDFRATRFAGHRIFTIPNESSGEAEWWMEVDGEAMRFELDDDGQIIAKVRQPDGSSVEEVRDDLWFIDEETGQEIFWGVDVGGRSAKWIRGDESVAFQSTQTGVQEIRNAAVDYIPLRKGILRGDAGKSLKFNRPVSNTLPTRVRNTAVLAGAAFFVVMPLALVLGIITGINEGTILDRVISIVSLAFTATPEYVTGVFLILIFVVNWRVAKLPLFLTSDAIFEDPSLLILPVATLTAVELGYVVRMTRASMVEVMGAPYIRTAIIKGMPFGRVVIRHAIRNALMAPITIIMLHINYLIGGVVVVEVIFGYPGLGSYIFEASQFNDPNAVEAAAMVTVLIAVATRLLGDLAYTFLNPRIRYS